MSVLELSGYGLRRALIAGMQRVIAQRDEINRINVYPVPDHDTGTNLAAALGAVLQGMRVAQGAGTDKVLQQVAVLAADGARGNSGAILAQFFQGSAEAAASHRRLTLPALAASAGRGAAMARTAMAEPREGTMLSVIQVFSDELQRAAADERGDIRVAFGQALIRTREALQQTRGQIPALRSAGVVDAGAMGFVELLEGVSEYIECGRALRIDAIPAELAASGVDAEEDQGFSGTRRYCAECVISAERVDRAELKAALRAMPRSRLVITGTREQVRLHAHVDEPGQLFAVAARFGTVAQERIEDMGLKIQPIENRRTGVVIAMDTGGDVPADEIVRLGIHLVPQRLTVEGRDEIDRVSISSQEFYHAMRTSPAPLRTSQPSPGDFRRMFEFLLTHHEHVIDVSLARALSGTLQSAERAASRTAVGRVHVFDTCSASAGQGLLTIWAAEAAQAGLGHQAILAGLDRMRLCTQVYAVVRDIRYAVQGGRAPQIALHLTRWLRFFLTLTTRPNGRLGLMGALWGGKQLPERFARAVLARLDPARRYRVLIGHCDCAEEAERVRVAVLAGNRSIDRVWVMACGVAIGAHAGPGSLVIGVQDYEPPSP